MRIEGGMGGGGADVVAGCGLGVGEACECV